MSEAAASIPFALAFVAGLVSFLSPCVLPIVPGYVGFVTGMSLDDLAEGRSDVRRHAAIHAGLFVLGFSLVFLALGASASALGTVVRDSLPLIQQVGAVVIGIFGLYLLDIVKIPTLMRERRFHLARRPAGRIGAVIVGIAFGAGWTPCIGPVLASVLLYASFEETVIRGVMLLGAYALGLGIPFFLAAVSVNWFLAGSARVRHWILPAQRVAGGLLLVIAVLLFTGRFAAMTSFLARFSPPIEVGL